MKLIHKHEKTFSKKRIDYIYEHDNSYILFSYDFLNELRVQNLKFEESTKYNISTLLSITEEQLFQYSLLDEYIVLAMDFIKLNEDDLK